MAGKTKRTGSRPGTPKNTTPRASVDIPGKGQLGHMGLKSSPYAPTDCKLVNQYMVLDRMQAHYKKLNKTKAAVDTSAPKAWLVSQKMRDAARREAIAGSPRKSSGGAATSRYRGMRSSRPGSVAGSEDERDEMFAMMESVSRMEEGDLDELDGHHPGRTSTSMEIHHSDSSTFKRGGRSDMQFVNRMVNDQEHSPSKYYTGRTYQSNIPPSRTSKGNLEATRVVAQKPLYRTQILETYTSHTPMPHAKGKPSTPRSSDLIEQNASKFTEEKPFQPRTLKSNRKSKLSEFKYYTPPKRKDDENHIEEEPATQTIRPDSAMSNKAPSMRASLKSRPGTANTMNSTDWMNESIVSRDHTQRDTPQGVPALDISIDQDHFKWITEQQTKAQLRLSAKSPHSTLGSTRHSELADTQKANGTLGRSNGLANFTLQGTVKDTGFEGLETQRQIREEEEELKYLQFIQDVTNDVLDRGIFTNRVLKVVFESHVDRRKHELRVSKMREMLEDLRIDLGIPANDDEENPDGLGLSSTWKHHHSPRSSTNPRASRRSRHDNSQMGGTLRPSNLPTLQHTAPPPRRGGRTPSPEGKPPIPRPNSRGSRGAQSPSPSRSQEKSSSKDDSVFDTIFNGVSKTADILTIDHDDAPTEAAVSDFMRSGPMSSTMKAGDEGSISPSDEEEDQAALYERQLADTIDDGSLSGSETDRGRKTPVYSDDETARTPKRTLINSDDETPRRGKGKRTPIPSDNETPRRTPRRTPAHSDNETPRGSSAKNSPFHSDDEAALKTPTKFTPNHSEDDETARKTPISHTPIHSDDETRDRSPSAASDVSNTLDTKNFDTKAGEIIDGETLKENELNHAPPKPTPRERRRKASDLKESARSQANTTTDSIEVSELEDDDDYDTF